jgi:hypothetical protein
MVLDDFDQLPSSTLTLRDDRSALRLDPRAVVRLFLGAHSEIT